MKAKKTILLPLIVFVSVLIISFITFYMDKLQKEKILEENYVKNTFSNYKAVYLVYKKMIDYFVADDVKNSNLEYFLFKNKIEKVKEFLNEKFQILKKQNISNIFIVNINGKVIVSLPENSEKYKIEHLAKNQFVYPLKYRNSFLGNLYVSVPFSAFQDDLNSIYYDTYLFLLKKEIGLEKVISGTASSLIASEFSKDFYYEKITIKDIPVSIINLKIKDKVVKLLNSRKAFSIPYILNGNPILITFIPIFTSNGTFLGYLIRYSIDYNYALIIRSFYFNIVAAIIIDLVLSSLVFLVLKEGERLKLLAETDPLTGLYNKGKFNEVLQKEIERAKRYKRPLSIIVFDIDHFKKINDTYGHKIGDDVLKSLAKIIKSSVRKTDFAARWGGEEFVILLPETDLEGARKVAEKLREKVEKHKFPGVGKVTISLGVAQLKDNEDPNDFIVRADMALYKAKEGGRNRVEVAT